MACLLGGDNVQNKADTQFTRIGYCNIPCLYNSVSACLSSSGLELYRRLEPHFHQMRNPRNCVSIRYNELRTFDKEGKEITKSKLKNWREIAVKCLSVSALDTGRWAPKRRAYADSSGFTWAFKANQNGQWPHLKNASGKGYPCMSRWCRLRNDWPRFFLQRKLWLHPWHSAICRLPLSSLPHTTPTFHTM